MEKIEPIVLLLTAVSGLVFFLWKREWRHRLQIHIDIDTFGLIDLDYFLVESACTIENKGMLRSYIYRMDMSIRYILSSESLECGGDEISNATNFKHYAAKINLIKPEWEWSFIEAGTVQRYSHVIHIPSMASAILVWVKVRYNKYSSEEFYTVQRVFIVSDGKLVKPFSWMSVSESS